MVYHNIIQLSNNFITKGLVPLEKLSDQNDVPRNPLSISPEDDIEESKIGVDENIKNIKICAYLPHEVITEYLKLLKKIINMFFLGLMQN